VEKGDDRDSAKSGYKSYIKYKYLITFLCFFAKIAKTKFMNLAIFTFLFLFPHHSNWKHPKSLLFQFF